MASMTDEFIDSAVAAAAGLALLFVGVPDVEMMRALHEVRAAVQANLAEAFGADIATVIAETFVATVVRRRREIEPAGGEARMLN
jgi:hypothetical protein